MSGPSSRSFDAESLLHSLMENVPGAIYRAADDDIWKIQRVSDEIESITGYPASDFVDASKRTIVAVTHPDDREPVDREIREATAAHRPFVLEYRILHADGSVRWVLERGVKTVDRDGVEWLDGIIFDITERRAAEELRIERELEAIRIAELEASRARLVAAGDDARRRIERDLHDGAQQQLVSLALDLRMLKARLADSGLSGTVDEIGEKLAVALAELREFARGIHPAFLSERGVQAAVEALVARAPLDVEAGIELPERLPAPVEAAAYFVVAEGLTNVIRYAETRTASVRVYEEGGEVVVVVSDDGRGGATIAGGTGLRGLIDRLQVLDGRLTVVSPPGEGTRLEAHIPIEAGSLVAEASEIRAWPVHPLPPIDSQP